MKVRKSLHWFAITLWVFAILYVLVISPVGWLLYRNAAEMAQESHRAAIQADLAKTAWDIFEGGVVTSLELAAAGFLIELLDSVRWNMTPPDERAYQGSRAGSRPVTTNAPTSQASSPGLIP